MLYGGNRELQAGVSQILPDRYRAALELVRFLIARGRRRIAYLGTDFEEEPRSRAYSDALAEAGLPQMIHRQHEQSGDAHPDQHLPQRRQIA